MLVELLLREVNKRALDTVLAGVLAYVQAEPGTYTLKSLARVMRRSGAPRRPVVIQRPVINVSCPELSIASSSLVAGRKVGNGVIRDMRLKGRYFEVAPICDR